MNRCCSVFGGGTNATGAPERGGGAKPIVGADDWNAAGAPIGGGAKNVPLLLVCCIGVGVGGWNWPLDGYAADEDDMSC